MTSDQIRNVSAKPAGDSNQPSPFTRMDICLALFFVCLALAVRFWNLPAFEVISTDGTGYADSANRILSGDFSLLARYGFYPILVAIAHFFISDVELSGRLASTIMGGLLLLPTYAIGLRLFNRQLAICTSILTVLWPGLIWCSGEVMTQSTYVTLTMIGIWLVWETVSRRSTALAFSAGFLMGLAYVTRTEAFMLTFVILSAPAIMVIHNRSDLGNFTKLITVYFAGFGVILLPNLIMVHNATGEWQLAVKTSGALGDGVTYYLKSINAEIPHSLLDVHYLDVIRSYPGYFSYNISKNLRDTWKLFPYLYWILAAIGFIFSGWNRSACLRRVFLVSILAPCAFILIFFYIDTGYFLPYQPVFFIWISCGLIYAEKSITSLSMPRTLRHVLSKVPISIIATATIAFLVFSLNYIFQVSKPPIQNNPVDGRISQKELGLVIRSFLPPGKVMTPWPRTGFYAEREITGFIDSSLDKIIDDARRENARFILVDPMLLNTFPQLAPLFEPAGLLLSLPPPQKWEVQLLADKNISSYPGTRLYLLYRDHKRVTAAIHEVLPK